MKDFFVTLIFGHFHFRCFQLINLFVNFDEGIRAIEEHGHFELNGDSEIMGPMDALLTAFVEQQRMKLPGTEYVPCYKIIK